MVLACVLGLVAVGLALFDANNSVTQFDNTVTKLVLLDVGGEAGGHVPPVIRITPITELGGTSVTPVSCKLIGGLVNVFRNAQNPTIDPCNPDNFQVITQTSGLNDLIIVDDPGNPTLFTTNTSFFTEIRFNLTSSGTIDSLFPKLLLSVTGDLANEDAVKGKDFPSVDNYAILNYKHQTVIYFEELPYIPLDDSNTRRFIRHATVSSTLVDSMPADFSLIFSWDSMTVYNYVDDQDVIPEGLASLIIGTIAVVLASIAFLVSLVKPNKIKGL